MPQSLKLQNIETYQEKFTHKLLDFASKENIYKRFLLGDKYKETEALYTILMQKKLCPQNCEMVDYIRDKISGALNHKKVDAMKPLTYYIKIDIENNNNNYVFDWNEIQW